MTVKWNQKNVLGFNSIVFFAHRTTSFFISSEKWNLIFKFRVILSYDSEIKQKKCPGLNCTYCLFLLHNNNDVHPTTTSSFFIPSENEIWSVWCSGWAKLVWWPHNGTPRSFQVEFSSNYYSCSGRSLDRVWPSKTQNLFTLYENIILQKFTDTIIQVLKFFFQPLTSWRLSEAVSVSMVWRLCN